MWHTKIVASKEALAFYEALVNAYNSGAFEECHVFNGARSRKGTPVLGMGGTTGQGPKLIGKYLGLSISGRRICKTPGCLNILHYEVDGGPGPRGEAEHIAEMPRASDSDLKDAIEFLRDRKDLGGPRTKAFYREHIHPDDMSDLDLDRAWAILPQAWKQE
ncbi:hypothetical protein Lumi_066 [Xylophilus phage Lumi]|nr:hypothetical protein Lumi_066 [Xylophilus phage Lumi]